MKVLSKFGSDQAPEVRIRVSQCLAMIAANSGGFNTVSIVPLLTLALKYVVDDIPRVRFSFASTVGTLIATSVPLTADSASPTRKSSSGGGMFSSLSKTKIPKAFTVRSAFEFFVLQFHRTSSPSNRAGMLLASMFFVRSVLPSLTSSDHPSLVGGFASLLCATSKFDGSAAVSRIIRWGFIEGSCESEQLAFSSVVARVLRQYDPSKDAGGDVTSCLLHELHWQLLVLGEAIRPLEDSILSAINHLLSSPVRVFLDQRLPTC